LIITRSPLRISLGGGGTDLPSYYREHGGFVIAAAINKYVYLTVHEPFTDEIILKYSQMEHVKTPSEVRHPILREALKLTGIDGRVEIASICDIPSGSGLGSSGSFTTALLRGLHALQKTNVTARELAEQACHIEIDILGEPVGKQDQYASAYGGITGFTFSWDKIKIEPLDISVETLHNLEDNLMLFFTGFTRSASKILQEQDSRSRQKDSSMIENLHYVKQLGLESRKMLESGDLRGFGELMNVHWEHKKARSQSMTNPEIDGWYRHARCNGAVGGKLIGAGGGGFLLLYTEQKTRLRRAMTDIGLREVRFRFDFEGTRIVAQS
jgi:D-glycero-alpha-D-manno-heptose-7-phosphate kinase